MYFKNDLEIHTVIKIATIGDNSFGMSTFHELFLSIIDFDYSINITLINDNIFPQLLF